MKKLFLSLLLLLCAAPLFGGEMWAIGVRAGIPFSDAFKAVETSDFSFKSATQRFTIGPSVEFFFPLGLGVEADVLYRRTEVSASETIDSETLIQEKTVGIWEIPVMAKWRLPGDNLRPFVGAGGSYRSFGDLPSVSTSINDSGWGVVFGAGLEIKVRRVRISPEVRYTRWGSGQQGAGDSLIRYNQNQADFLVGITF